MAANVQASKHVTRAVERADGGREVTVAGAGPAGLSAAITAARAGWTARVHESRAGVGERFHGDFQGIENWTTRGDVLEDLARIGIEPNFEYTPYRECVFFGPDGRARVCRSPQPLWYLVRRGPGEGTLDEALERQARSAGVELRFGQAVSHLPEGGIVAHGPRRPDAIAVGYVFDCDQTDGAYGVVSAELAPGGYAYLLVCRGRATLATCLFAGFHDERIHLARTVEFFERKVGVHLANARRFGGYGNFSFDLRARKGNLLFVGEAAGLQDALFGFGMRYALHSGHLAARAWTEGRPEAYEESCRRTFGRLRRAAFVNRFVYERMGTLGHRILTDHLTSARDPRSWLRGQYRAFWRTIPVYPLARRERFRAAGLVDECRQGCDCTFCRCVSHRPEDRREIDEGPGPCP